MARYDVHRAFESIPQIMGMELRRNGDSWVGGYYLDGNRHPFRKDKLKVRKWNNDIIIHEEGGESMMICKWLQQYGGASDFWNAVQILRGHESPIVYVPKARTVVQEMRYVDKDVLEAARKWDFERCNLFNWMVGLFGEEKVREVWRKYNVTTNFNGDAVFWYVDADGHILHDKSMKYKPDGHRDKEAYCGRRFTMGKGYTGKCFFGAHLFREEEHVYVVESEKTALLVALYYGKPCMAVGGKNALGNIGGGDKLVLLPDIDARAEWEEQGFVWPWWNHFEHVGDHDDIGDAIVKRIMKNKR